MVRLLVAVIAFSVLGYLAYTTIYKARVDAAGESVAHAPRRQLDNVREKAKSFETGDQQRFDALDRQTTGE
jgi:hypothetical protein